MSRKELGLEGQDQGIDRRELLRRGLVMSPLLIPLIAACSPARGTQTQANPTPYEIPAHIRGQLPESIARATEEAARPKEPGLPTEHDIKIMAEAFSNFQPSSIPGAEGIWGGWIVKLDRKDYYLKKGVFSMEKRTPGGSIIGKPAELTSHMLPSGTEFFVPAVTGLEQQPYQTGNGSKLGQISLQMGKMEWAKVDDSPREYPFRVSLPDNPFSYERISPFTNSPSALKMNISFENTGELAITSLGALAIAVDGSGNIQDILSPGGTLGRSNIRVSYGQKIAIPLRSTLVYAWGQTYSFSCAIPPTEDTRIIYWIYFNTRTGMPVVHQDTIKVGA